MSETSSGNMSLIVQIWGMGRILNLLIECDFEALTHDRSTTRDCPSLFGKQLWR